MPNTLLLRLPAAGQYDTEWLSVEDAEGSVATRQRGPLSLAAAAGRAANIVVIAPAAHILLAEPDLPPGGGAKLARAVPFALEEQLTEDVDLLVFALGRRSATGATPVAVTSRSVLQGWLAELSAAGIEPAAIYADMSLLPANPGQTVLWYESGRLAVRRPGRLPFAVELTPISEALIVAGVIADPLEPLTGAGQESVILYATREDWAIVGPEFEALAERFAALKIQLLPDGPLPWLARGLEAGDAVNLLQGEFARTTDYGTRWRRWRTAAALAAALLLVHIAAQAMVLRQAQHRSAELDSDIAQVFAAAMPSETLREPRRQMQSRLERIHHSGPGAEQFLHTLRVLGGALGPTPNTHIDSMSYHENSLEMKVTAPSLAALSQLTKTIAAEGLAAEIQSSAPAGTGVEAHLQLRGSASKVRP